MSFYDEFHAKSDVLATRITTLSDPSLSNDKRQELTSALLMDITNLTHAVADAAEQTSDYDRMTYGKVLKSLREQLTAASAKSAPKSKFAFKSKARPRTAVSNTSSQQAFATPVDSPAIESIQSAESYSLTIAEMTISGKIDSHILVPQSSMQTTSSGALTNLTRCLVNLEAPSGSADVPLATLTVKDIRNSLILTGRVDGPVHITGVNDSVLVVEARQVRIHDCARTDFYVYCTSNPIIEDCSRLRFAPLPMATSSKHASSQNLWDQVQDFKWIKAEPSPNWSVMADTDCLPEETWSKLMTDDQSSNPASLLTMAGLP